MLNKQDILNTAKRKAEQFGKAILFPVERHRNIYRADGKWYIQPIIYTILFVVAFIFISEIFSIKAEDIINNSSQHESNLWWAIICQFADPGNIPLANTKGAIIAALCAFGGIFCLSGLFVSSLVSYNSRRAEKWRNGLIRYNNNWYNRFFFKDYIVIIGVNEQAATIAKKSLRRPDVKYVLIQTKNEVEKERFKLELKLNRIDEEKVVFYFGDRTIYEDIKDLELERAKEVYILGEDMSDKDEQDHDSYSMKCLELISRYCEKLPKKKKKCWIGKKLRCHVNFEYQSTYTIFKSTHIYKKLNEDVEFLPFNIHEIWAKKVLVDNYAIIPGNRVDESSVQRYLPLDCYKDEQTNRYVGISCDSDMSVHLFVVGMNQMGTALALQAALLIHLPNYHTKGCRTTITFIDEQATREGEFLEERFSALFALCRHRTIKCKKGERIKRWEEENDEDIDPMCDENSPYHHLGSGGNFMDIQWEFIEGNVASKEILDYMEDCVNDGKKTCTVAVCLNNPAKSIAMALYFPESIMKKVLQVLVYQQNSFDLTQKVATGETEWKRYEKLKPFGMQEDCYKETMFDNILAKLALATYMKGNLQYSKGNIDFFINYINELWSEEGIVNKMSNINLIDSFSSKLRSAGLSVFSSNEECNTALNNDEMILLLSKAEHNRWLTERLTLGYRPLYDDEMAYFLNLDDDKKRKIRKEYLKRKKRAHLDICSYETLAMVDKTLMNDSRIIRNLLRLRFHRRESEIRCRKILAPVKDNKKREWRKTYEYIRDMVCIPAGKLVRTKDNNDDENRPKGNKKMQAIWMGAYPVTQGLWEEVMGAKNNPSQYKGKERPVEMVSKENIEDFLVILYDRTGLHFSLPSKEEWLYAALAGHPASFYQDNGVIERQAWYHDRHANGTHEVCQKEKNDFGLFDMLGNVWEWSRTAADRLGDTFFFLGGSWKFSKKECDLSNAEGRWSRHWHLDYKSADLGFRLMLPYSFEKDDSEVKEQETEKYRIFYQILKQLRKIESGQFRMGVGEKTLFDGTNTITTTPRERNAFSNIIEMSAFWMAEAPLTQRQWNAFMGYNPSEHKGRDLPVEKVSYDDALAFIEKINEFFRKEFQSLLSEDKLFCLPTESQWEFAAKGGGENTNDTDGYPIYSGTISKEKGPDAVAWHNGITKCTNPVKGKEPNENKLYDMCGNVWEWCKDWWAEDCTKILKGGSWRSAPGECRVTNCCDWPLDHKGNDIGFRLVLSVEAYAEYEAMMEARKNNQADNIIKS